MEAHNSFAGQGSVLLDIGGDIGALVVSMPAEMAGVEIEIRPIGADHHHADHHHADHHHADHAYGDDTQHSHSHAGHSHPGHPNSHDDPPPSREAAHPHPHVAVIGRPTAAGPAYTAVFPELREGTYELYEKLGGPVALHTTITGGQVQHTTWPS